MPPTKSAFHPTTFYCTSILEQIHYQSLTYYSMVVLHEWFGNRAIGKQSSNSGSVQREEMLMHSTTLMIATMMGRTLNLPPVVIHFTLQPPKYLLNIWEY